MPSIAGNLLLKFTHNDSNAAAEEQPPLGDALELLHNASRTSAKQRTAKVSAIVDIICRFALTHGLDAEALDAVIHIASRKTELDQTSVTTLIKNLYPTQRVSGDVIVTVVAALGHGKGKPSPSTQDSLVKWLALVHEIVEDANVLSRLYGVLFGMLDMISIRTSLCHLLSLITRRKHVKPFRIQQLLELSRGLGNEPALQGLLRVYKDYYPDIILGSAPTSRKSFAPQPDAEWQIRVRTIQEARAANHPATEVQNGFKVLRRGPKRTKVSALPDVHTYQATESSVTLEGIDGVEAFVEKLDRIEPPGQLISFLTDPLLQKFVELKPSPIVSARIDLWLVTCLEDQASAAVRGTEDTALLAELLNALLQHARYTKTLLSTTLAFLKEYISVWNGRDNVDAVLGLLAYVPGDLFEDIHAEYFAPVERALSSNGSLSSYVGVADLYFSLLQHRIALLSQQEPKHHQSALSSPAQQFLRDSASHFATMSTSLVLSLPPQTGHDVVSAVLRYWELLSISSKPHVIPIVLPPMHFVYHLIQSPSTAIVSRVCGIVGNYKEAFDAHPRPVKHYYPNEVTDGLNWCLRDIYNLFWVARGLAVAENKSVGMYCDPTLRSSLNEYLVGLDPEHTIGHMFNLSNNAWLSAMSSAAWYALEEREIDRAKLDRSNVQRHAGPVSQQSLAALRNAGIDVDWEGADGYKVYVLNWLAERGLDGLRKLMFATVTDLRSVQASTS